MKKQDRFNQLAKTIIDAHPTGVHQLLIAKGITKQASPEVLLDVYKIYGSPFISELVDLVYSKSKFDGSFDEYMDQEVEKSTQNIINAGNTTTAQTTFNTSVADGTTKKTFWDNLSTVFNSAANLGNAATGVISSVKTTSSSVGSTLQSLTSGTPLTQQQKNTGNTMLIVGIVIVVILLIIIFITKRKS